MNFACENCQRRYSIPDEKVRGKTVRVRCKNCQSPITLRGDRLEAAAPPGEAAPVQSAGAARSRSNHPGSASIGAMPTPVSTPAPAARAPVTSPPAAAKPSGGEWYVMLKGQQVGPLPEAQLLAHVQSGEVSPRSFFWRKGMADWKRGLEIPELEGVLAGELSSRKEAPRSAPPIAESQPAERGGTLELFSDASSVIRGPTDTAVDVPATASTDERFSDKGEESGPLEKVEKKKKKKAEPEPAFDPFAMLGDIDPDKLPPPGEATQFFIAQAGVNKRNPPWKIALFIGAWIAIPAALIYLLTSLQVVPLEVTRIDESGQEVTESVFSQGVVSGIGSLLSGKTIKAKQEAERVRQTLQQSGGPKAAQKAPPSGATQPGSTSAAPAGVDLAAFYGEKKDRGPVARKDIEVKQKDGQVGGPEAEAVAKVVSASQPAFQFCVEEELKKNPSFRGGKIMLSTTIGSSGVVKSARIDRREIDSSRLGECLKGKAKRMMFGSFEGEDLEVEFPLILTSAM